MSAHRRPVRRYRPRPALALAVLAGVLVALPLLAPQPRPRVPHLAAATPAVIAHGGAQAYAPANTLEAFRLAVEQGADALEMDLQLTADGELVVHHDATVDRQTDGTGAVADLTLAEVRELDAGHGFEGADGGFPYRGEGVRIPTFEEVLAAFPDTFLVVEMKTEGGPAIAEATAERIAATGSAGRVAVASFSLDHLERFRSLAPGVPTNLPEGEARQFVVRQLAGVDRWWDPPGRFLQVPEEHEGQRVVTPGLVAAAERRGVDVQVWTVNEADDMRRLLTIGVHGIITDRPDLLRRVIAEHTAGTPSAQGEQGGLGAVRWLQEELPAVTPIMQVVTLLGDEDFYVLVFPVLFWAVSQRAGARLGVMLLLSAGLNEVAKLAWRTPRPSFLDPSLTRVSDTTMGVPSGHAQNGVVVWGLLASEARRRWAWTAAAALAVVLGLSRVQLGAHFVVDVLAGWLLGGVLLLAYLRLRDPVTAWLSARTPRAQVWAAFAASMALIALGVAARLAFLAWQPPATWVGIEPGEWPVRLSAVVTPAGALFGLGLGLVLLRRHGGFDTGGPAWARGARCLVGLLGVVVLWQGLGALLPDGEDVVALAYRYARYALVGAWIAAGAPLLFVSLGLARPADRPVPSATADHPGAGETAQADREAQGRP